MVKRECIQRYVPVTKGKSSDLVLSGPMTLAIIGRFLMEFILLLGSSDFSSLISVAIGVVAVVISNF